MSHRTAVVLLNLGGPDSLPAVRPFLYNLFSDPDIFRLPLARLTQKPFAALMSRRRAPEAAKGYAAIGGKSPLLANTRAQAEALQQALTVSTVSARAAGAGAGAATETATRLADVHICMRYWHPMAPEVVETLRREDYTRVILLPLYPQYSNTTTGSSHNAFVRECRRQGYAPRIQLIREWYQEPAYQEAVVAALKRELARFPDPRPEAVELLFSAHGLPRKLVDAGDPYEQQIEATVAALRERLGWPHVTLCYQSRVGPLEWLRPYTDEVIRAKGRAGCKQALVYPIAFVSDHVETLYELGMTYADLAQQSGIAHYRVAPALNDDPGLIDALRTCVQRVLG